MLTPVFELQFFNDKHRFESMTMQMQEDVVEAEIEPVPAPIDTYCASTMKVKIREPSKKSLDKKFSPTNRTNTKRKSRLVPRQSFSFRPIEFLSIISG